MLEPAVADAVSEIDDQPAEKPRPESDPGHGGQAVHQIEAEHDRDERGERDARRAELPFEVRFLLPQHDDPETWLSRGEVARLLGVSNVSVLLYTKNGTLHPIRDARGDNRYDPDEVNAYSAAHPRGRIILTKGELAAAFAQLMSENKGRRDAVIELRITFEQADRLYTEWMRGNEFPGAVAERAKERAQRAETRALRAHERAREQRRAHARRVVREALKGLRREPTSTR